MIKQSKEDLVKKIKSLEEQKKTMSDKVALHYLNKRIELAKMFLKQKEQEDSQEK